MSEEIIKPGQIITGTLFNEPDWKRNAERLGEPDFSEHRASDNP